LRCELGGLGFDEAEAFLISIAVGLTRDIALTPLADGKDRALAIFSRPQLVDALAVTFMFNIVNRIANFYNLQPEWTQLRRTERLQRITRPLMAFGLLRQMPLTPDQSESGVFLDESIKTLLNELGVDQVSSVWSQLHVLPPVELAIFQLLSVAVYETATSDSLLDKVTRDCLDFAQQSDSPVADTIWTKLFSEPHKMSRQDVDELAMESRTKLDVVYRVALRSSIAKLSGSEVEGLLVHATNVA
jgi:hypothetical protein